MKGTSTAALLACAVLGLAACGQKPAEPVKTARPVADVAKDKSNADAAALQAKVKEAAAIAHDAYIYGYSLITTEVTRVQMSNVPKHEGLQSPMGHFTNVPRYPPADYRCVSAPNADTLYSLAWVDIRTTGSKSPGNG